MNPTQMTLLEQMRITQIEMESRKGLLNFCDQDVRLLLQCKPFIESNIDNIVASFYITQTSIPEIASLIGDADTLTRLQSAQRQYILDLFDGNYDLEYVNNRLRIGLVHKRIGVEPKLYLSAIHLLRSLLIENIKKYQKNIKSIDDTIAALDKLIFYDITLVFETYIQSMLSEIETAKNRSEQYAKALEETMVKRMGELRTDALTGLTTRRYLHDVLQSTIRGAQIRSEPVSLVFVDINGFKKVNDTQGHVHGDKILKELGAILLEAARAEDTCIRYGGDEFCIVLTNNTEDQAKKLYCDRVNKLLTERLSNVTVSMGIIQTGPDLYEDSETLLNKADKRMYAQKAEIKNGLSLNS